MSGVHIFLVFAFFMNMKIMSLWLIFKFKFNLNNNLGFIKRKHINGILFDSPIASEEEDWCHKHGSAAMIASLIQGREHHEATITCLHI